MTRAEIRNQMMAMRNQVSMMYDRNPKRGQCEPKFDMPDEIRLSSMSTTMTRQVQSSLQKERKTVKKMGKVYNGPHIAGFSVDKQHMPVITNGTHSAQTNNGFARKPCGGFYFH